MMEKCFVMQPFDGGVFDKRYDDVFEPAILDSGLEPYRVDRDPSVSIPIDDIEIGIKRSEICLAEITTDNPNVWFELGFAIAVPKEVVLICSDERKSKFPFDVQHRNIIRYSTEAPQDFQKLREKISERIKAIIKKKDEIEKITRISPVAESEGLTQHEMVALVSVMQNSFMSIGGGVSAYTIKEDMNSAGFTDIAVSLAITGLREKVMIKGSQEKDVQGYEYRCFTILSQGEKWLLDNQNKLVLRDQKPDDEIPF